MRGTPTVGEGKKSFPNLLFWRGEARYPGYATGVNGLCATQGIVNPFTPKQAHPALKFIQMEPFLQLGFSPGSVASHSTSQKDFSLQLPSSITFLCQHLKQLEVFLV